MEDSFSTGGRVWGMGVGGYMVVQAVMGSGGEQQMKPRSLSRRSPPAVRPGS